MFMLEGNIGSGKSTFLSLIKKNLAIDVFFEPTDQWQKVGSSGNLLDLFYRDMPRWAYTFQSYAFLTRLRGLLDREHNKSGLAERSIFCDRFCFAKNCFERGVMSEIEWQLYQEWFAWLAERCMPRPSGFIYLKVSPEICYERLKKRSRSEENAVPLTYLQEIHRKHEEWLVEKKEKFTLLEGVPVLVVDGNHDFEHDLVRQKILMEEIYNFMQKAINNAKEGNNALFHQEKFDNQSGMFS